MQGYRRENEKPPARNVGGLICFISKVASPKVNSKKWHFPKEITMLNCPRITLLLFIVLLVGPSVVRSETLYVSDQLVVSLRELPQDNSKTIAYLKTNEPVELIEGGEKYSKVKTASGEVGYIQNYYLAKDLPKPIIISRLTEENEALNKRVKQLQNQYKEAFSKGDEARTKLLTELEESRTKTDKLQTELNDSNQKLSEIYKEYESLKENSKNITAITEERNQLKVSNNELSATLKNLEQERQVWLRNGIIKWFLAGGGVLLLGWVIGKFSKSRRRSSLY